MVTRPRHLPAQEETDPTQETTLLTDQPRIAETLVTTDTKDKAPSEEEEAEEVLELVAEVAAEEATAPTDLTQKPGDSLVEGGAPADLTTEAAHRILAETRVEDTLGQRSIWTGRKQLAEQPVTYYQDRAQTRTTTQVGRT